MINLLMRLYDADEGRILIDGIPITEYESDCLHSQIGVVLQETFLFTGTIFDNIRYAKPDATKEEVIRAAKMANAHEFIIKFPDGYDTYVGERGTTLSGGERQRVAIARAILHDPRLLILDEATSSLDTETEYQIQEAMNRLVKGRTTIAIGLTACPLCGRRIGSWYWIATISPRWEHTTNCCGARGSITLVMAQLEMHKVRGA